MSLDMENSLEATVDEPPPGPHLYRARAALTTGEEFET